VIDENVLIPKASKWRLGDEAPRLPVERLKDIHRGQDIYVIGSAASMNHVRPSFFENKVAISVNYAYRQFPCEWVVTKDLCQTEYNEVGHRLITSDYLWGIYREKQQVFYGQEPYFVFTHVDNLTDEIDLDVIGSEKIFVGKSSLTSAMHVAAHMGAANIILCGVDGGTLDGELQYHDYYNRVKDPAGIETYHKFVASIMWQTRAVRDRLHAVYGCNVYSLNPFIGFDLEGHKYERPDPGQGDVPQDSPEKPAAAGGDAAARLGDLESPPLAS